MTRKGGGSALEKAIRTLVVIAGRPGSWGVRELGRTLDYGPATIFRILDTFEKYGFVQQDAETHRYRLGNIFYSFANTLTRTNRLVETAFGPMKELCETTRETVYLNISEQGQRVCISSIDSPEPVRATMAVGRRAPLHRGASSRCLLGFAQEDERERYLKNMCGAMQAEALSQLRRELRAVRKRRYGYGLNEIVQGFGALSAPILNREGFAVASLSIGMPESRYRDRAHRMKCLEQLLASCRRLEDLLRYGAKANVLDRLGG